jgi:glutamyl-tRNA synthetase/nondiscriminating glutamyl-tRNA synthetase
LPSRSLAKTIAMPDEQIESRTARANSFAGAHVLEILRERGWLAGEASPEHLAWCDRAAFLLGPQVTDRDALADLLQLVFYYDAPAILAKVEGHIVLSRYAAREVLRLFAAELLDGGPLGSERFSEIITAMKARIEARGREMFHPIRLALTGRSGEGALDRVILLLDDAAALPFATSVKSARTRVLDFCSHLDE